MLKIIWLIITFLLSGVFKLNSNNSENLYGEVETECMVTEEAETVMEYVTETESETETEFKPEVETELKTESETVVDETHQSIEIIPEPVYETTPAPDIEEKTESPIIIVPEETVTEEESLSYSQREIRGLLSREEIIQKTLEGFNYARTHADANRYGKAFKPVTINETYSKYAQYYAEWLAENDPTLHSVESHSNCTLGWHPGREGLFFTAYDLFGAGTYQVDHIMFYGDESNLQIGIGAVYKNGGYYVVIQTWEHFEKYYPF